VFEDVVDDAGSYGEPFRADMVKSHFNHVFVCVRAVRLPHSPSPRFVVRAVLFRAAVALEHAHINPTLPDELDPTLSEHQRLFTAFLINAERACYRTGQLRTIAERTQRLQLEGIAQKHLK